MSNLNKLKLGRLHDGFWSKETDVQRNENSVALNTAFDAAIRYSNRCALFGQETTYRPLRKSPCVDLFKLNPDLTVRGFQNVLRTGKSLSQAEYRFGIDPSISVKESNCLDKSALSASHV